MNKAKNLPISSDFEKGLTPLVSEAWKAISA